MPLVVPDLGSDAQSQWFSKLAGKKIGDQHDATNFARQDLPKEHRIVAPGSMVTQDFNKDRMNIHVGEDGTVQKVDFK